MNEHKLIVIDGYKNKANLNIGEETVSSSGLLKSTMQISTYKDFIIYINDKMFDEDDAFTTMKHLLSTQKLKIKLILLNKELEKEHNILAGLHELLPDTRIELVAGPEGCKEMLSTNDIESIGNFKIAEERKMEKEIATEFDPWKNKAPKSTIVEPQAMEPDVLDDILNSLDDAPVVAEKAKPKKVNNKAPKKDKPKKTFVEKEQTVKSEPANPESTNTKVYKDWQPKADKDLVLVFMPNRELGKSYKDSLETASHIVYLDEYSKTECIKTVDTMCVTNVLDEAAFKELTSKGYNNIKNNHIQELFRVNNATHELDKELLISKYKKFSNKKTYFICNDKVTFEQMIPHASNIELLVSNNIQDTQAALKLYENFNSNNAIIKIYAGHTEVITNNKTVSVPVFTEMKK